MASLRQVIVAIGMSGVLAAPAAAAGWGLELHQGIESVGMRNGADELFSFVCNYGDPTHPGLLGVELELKPRGKLVTKTGTVELTSTLPSGRAGAKLSFPASFDDEQDVVGVATYSFTHAEAEALIALARRAATLTASVPALGLTASFAPTGGRGSWSRIDCKF